MEIQKIINSEKFDSLTKDWRTLEVWSFGPLVDLDDSDEDDNIQVLVATIESEPIAYLIAEDTEGWHVEVKEGHTGHAYGKQLAEAANIESAQEVCSDAGAILCETLDIEFDDCLIIALSRWDRCT